MKSDSACWYKIWRKTNRSAVKLWLKIQRSIWLHSIFMDYDHMTAFLSESVSLYHLNLIEVCWYFTEIWWFDYIEISSCQPCLIKWKLSVIYPLISTSALLYNIWRKLNNVMWRNAENTYFNVNMILFHHIEFLPIDVLYCLMLSIRDKLEHCKNS